MSSKPKSQGRWKYSSLFGSRATNKIITIEYPHTNDPAVQDVHCELVDRSIDHDRDTRPKAGRGSRIRRSGSKMLSILGLRHSVGSRDGYHTSSTPSERDMALAMVIDAASPAVLDTTSSDVRNINGRPKVPLKQRVVTPIAPNASTFRVPLSTIADTSQPYQVAELSLQYSDQARIVPLEVISKRKDPAGLRQSRSMPGLAHQLSHKISSTFGNPTIVHRPNLRTRPSLQSMPEIPTFSNSSGALEVPSPSTTDPLSLHHSWSGTPSSRSTPKTSLESNVASLQSSKTKDRSDKPPIQNGPTTIVERELPEKPLTPIQESPLMIHPTIMTVETTANAKIFFETHFNSILSGQATPRSLRRHELENRLHSQSLSAEQRHEERSLWAKQESEHLRQSRVLKSKSNHARSQRGVSVAGYEIIRILGKGSFGVVRLVREKDEREDRLSSADIAVGRLPTSDLGNLRMTAISAIKSLNSSTQRVASAKRRKEVYAMKVIRKSDMLRNSQEGHLRAERDFLVASEKSKWVVPLMASFQDSTNLYLVMEYMIGGDFLGLLIRKEQLKEKKTQWYIAEMILCIEEAHRLKWIHRDVKPDNFLITASGHLKISDFGLAFDGHWSHDQSYFNNHRYSLLDKLGIKVEGDAIDQAEDSKSVAGKKLARILMGGRERHEKALANEPGENESILAWRNRNGKRKFARSVVGTSQYMAPEIIRGEPYDGRCDWWSIGIIMFECLYGWTPFVGEDRQDTKAKILNHHESFEFPPTASTAKRYRVSFEAKDLINRMLQEKEHRLCSKKYAVNDHQQQTRGLAGKTTSLHPGAQDYHGHFVFPDDANDIKAHPFFAGIPWDRLDLTKPPEVPVVKSRHDTRYFDEEDPISEVDDGTSNDSLQEEELQAQEAYEAEIAAAFDRDTAMKAHNGDNTRVLQIGDHLVEPREPDTPGTVVANKTLGKTRERKRPRDRILRDRNVARQAMELRKKGAFLGYTYRRPWTAVDNNEASRISKESSSRRGRIPSVY